MCGRYTLRHNTDDIAARFEAVQISLDDALRRPRFNIAPTQAVPTITLAAPEAGAPRVLGAARWGLVPSWAKDPGIGSKMLNARAETLAEKPAFRVALQRRRCLIPADGFYEWQATTHKPHFIQLRRPLREGELFAFAGLWEEWWPPGTRPGAGGEPLRTCTIITVPPNGLMAALHDRMPAILRPQDEAAWLTPQRSTTELLDLLRPYPDPEEGSEEEDPRLGALQAEPVSRRVNRVGHDAPDCLAPPDEDEAPPPKKGRRARSSDSQPGLPGLDPSPKREERG